MAYEARLDPTMTLPGCVAVSALVLRGPDVLLLLLLPAFVRCFHDCVQPHERLGHRLPAGIPNDPFTKVSMKPSVPACGHTLAPLSPTTTHTVPAFVNRQADLSGCSLEEKFQKRDNADPRQLLHDVPLLLLQGANDTCQGGLCVGMWVLGTRNLNCFASLFSIRG